MPEITHTTNLQTADETTFVDAFNRPVMIKVDHVSMTFNMASEKMNNLKEYAIALAKRKLFFESFTALDDISFEVKKGDVFGILGTNGSGKSTLLKIIAGVLEPTSGYSETNGNIAPLIELGAGFDMELSARENIYLNGALLGYSKKFIDNHFDEIVDFAEVEKFLDMPMKNYSSGMVARIAFAIATVIVPDILIVDEVLSVGDFMFQKKCEDRINDLITKHGVTVLIVSHSNDQIERLCNKAVWIEKGHVRILGDADKICNTYRVLGGRTGSAESESYLYGQIKELECTCPLRKTKVIGGESHLDIARNMALQQWGREIDSAVFVPDSAHTYSLLAVGIAGALNAPILPFDANDCLPSLFQITEGLNISNAYVLADADTVEEVRADFAALDTLARVDNITCERSLVGRRRDILDYGTSHGVWKGGFALVVPFEDSLSSFKASPFAYEASAPILVLYDEEESLDNETTESLRNAGISSLYAVGQKVHQKLSSDKSLEGFQIKQLDEETKPSRSASHPSNEGILPRSDSHDTIIIGSGNKSHWPSLIAAPPFAGASGMDLLLFNDEDLDSMARCLRTVSDSGADTVLIIGKSTLSPIERKLICHA